MASRATSTAANLRCVIVCDLEDKTRPVVLVSSNQVQDLAKHGACVIQKNPPAFLEDLVRDVLVGGTREECWGSHRLVYGADRDRICYGVIGGSVEHSRAELFSFLNRLVMKIAMSIQDDHRDLLDTAATSIGTAVILSLCQQHAREKAARRAREEFKLLLERKKAKRVQIVPSLSDSWDIHAAMIAPFAEEDLPVRAGPRRSVNLLSFFRYTPERLSLGHDGEIHISFGEKSFHILPIKKGYDVIGDHVHLEERSSTLHYTATAKGYYCAVVTEPACPHSVATYYLDKMSSCGGDSLPALCHEFCRASSDYQHEFSLEVSNPPNKSILIKNLTLEGMRPLEQPQTSNRKSRAPCTPVRLSSGRLEMFGRMAKRSPKAVLPRNRSNTLTRGFPPSRQESHGASTNLGSDWDELSCHWEAGPSVPSHVQEFLFFWGDLQPMDPMPTLFPYHETSGTSLPGLVSTVGSRGGSTIRTRSCDLVSWQRHG